MLTVLEVSDMNLGLQRGSVRVMVEMNNRKATHLTAVREERESSRVCNKALTPVCEAVTVAKDSSTGDVRTS